MTTSAFLRISTVLALAACGSRASTSTAPAPAAPATPPEVTPRAIAEGDSIFAVRACSRCHGPKGTGGTNGPDLTTGPWLHGGGAFPNLVRLITNGVPRDSLKTARQFAMNPRGGGTPLTDAQIQSVAAYVWSISRAKQ
jgi:mono/diheme cytochrome c family protein